MPPSTSETIWAAQPTCWQLAVPASVLQPGPLAASLCTILLVCTSAAGFCAFLNLPDCRNQAGGVSLLTVWAVLHQQQQELPPVLGCGSMAAAQRNSRWTGSPFCPPGEHCSSA